MERQRLGRAAAKALSNSRPQQSLGSGGVSIPGDTGATEQLCALTELQEPPQLPLSAHLTAWDPAGPCLGSGKEGGRQPWQKQWEREWPKGSCQGKAKENPGVAAASSLSSCTLQLQKLFRGSERDSPAVSNSRLLGQQEPSSQGLSIV